jgi:hypothetical protein
MRGTLAAPATSRPTSTRRITRSGAEGLIVGVADAPEVGTGEALGAGVSVGTGVDVGVANGVGVAVGSGVVVAAALAAELATDVTVGTGVGEAVGRAGGVAAGPGVTGTKLTGAAEGANETTTKATEVALGEGRRNDGNGVLVGDGGGLTVGRVSSTNTVAPTRMTSSPDSAAVSI